MQLAKSMPVKRRALYHLLAALALGLLFSVFGPFGTNPALDRATRYGFWVGLVMFGYGAAVIAALTLTNGIHADRFHRVIRLALVALASAIPTTFATAWALTFVQRGRVVALEDLPALYGAVLCVQIVLALVAQNVDVWMGGTTLESPGRVPEPSGDAAPSIPVFLERLPVTPGGDLIALEAVDHYLRVHRTQGSALIHMRLVDAIAELQGADGLQVHRSWWVARAAVSQMQRRGARTELLLTNGVVAPVSRTHLMAVRRTAWGFLPA